MFDHVGFTVSDFARARAFYLAALEPLGMGVLREGEDWAVIGDDSCRLRITASHGTAPPAAPVHIAFRTTSRGQVQAFHAAALAAGGRDNGGPGLREQYSPNYYGAFVLDPDGRNIEAVTHSAN